MFNWLRNLYVSILLFPLTLLAKCLIPVFRHVIRAKGLDPDKDYDKARRDELFNSLNSMFTIPHKITRLNSDNPEVGMIKRTMPAVSGHIKFPSTSDVEEDNKTRDRGVEDGMYSVPQRPEDLANACYERAYPSISSAMTDTEVLLRKLAETHGGPPKKLEIDTDTRVSADGYVNYSASVTVEDGYSTYFTGEPPIACSMDYQPIDLHQEVNLSELKVEVDEESLRVWRETFAAAQADPDFRVFTYLDAGEAPAPKKKSSKKPTAKAKKPVKKVSVKKKK